MRKGHSAHELPDLADFPELFQVLTLAETARHIGVHRTTVVNALNTGRLAAVQVGKIWLVSKASAERLWWRRIPCKK